MHFVNWQCYFNIYIRCDQPVTCIYIEEMYNHGSMYLYTISVKRQTFAFCCLSITWYLLGMSLVYAFWVLYYHLPSSTKHMTGNGHANFKQLDMCLVFLLTIAWYSLSDDVCRLISDFQTPSKQKRITCQEDTMEMTGFINQIPITWQKRWFNSCSKLIFTFAILIHV